MKDNENERPAAFFGIGDEQARCRKLISALSPTQQAILELLIRGEGTKGIARLLAMSEPTIDAHRKALLRRLRATRTEDAVRIALYAQL